MRLHERHELVSHAGVELSQAITGIVAKYHLTYGELITILSAEILGWANYLVSDERKGDVE